MKTIRILLAALLAAAACGCAKASGTATGADSEEMYQYSTIAALLEGCYDGEVTIGYIKEKAGFGLGTFDDLDGEMIVLDGTVYQVKYDGSVATPPDDTETPFAQLAVFDTEHTLAVSDVDGYGRLQEIIDREFPSDSIAYAFRIDGVFDYVKTRSVPAQQEPYPRLAEVVKEQSVFEFRDIEGTVAGFRNPGYMESINVTGYHMHFLNAGRNAGGHLLEVKVKEATVSVSSAYSIEFEAPQTECFVSLNSGKVKESELKAVEKDK